MFIDRRILLDIGIGRRHIGFRLVIVIVGNEIFDRVLRKELLELTIELRRQGLVRCHDDGGPLQPIDHVGNCEGLTRTRDAEQGLVGQPRLNAVNQLLDRNRLVARRLVVGLQLEAFLFHDALSLSRNDIVFGDRVGADCRREDGSHASAKTKEAAQVRLLTSAASFVLAPPRGLEPRTQ